MRFREVLNIMVLGSKCLLDKGVWRIEACSGRDSPKDECQRTAQ
jgi:hypothetical protein